MTIETPERDGVADDMLSKARQFYAVLSAELLDAVTHLKSGDAEKAKVSAAVISQHQKAFLTTLTMETDLEKRRQERAGIVHGYAIDLDAAGVEVGRRLARLRAARGSE